MTRLIGAVAIAGVVGTTGCGGATADGRSPVLLVINRLSAASGAQPSNFSGTLNSDTVTMVKVNNVPTPTIFDDLGDAAMILVLKNPGNPGNPSTPSPLNQVTITRYHVDYTRADGHNTPGVDVPFGFDSAVTVTVNQNQTDAVFEIVRHEAKQEAPVVNLVCTPAVSGVVCNRTIITTIATVTFYGQDLAGNAVSASGQIGINFGDFADPSS
jgi:hypothetical protein